jgi:Reeler domain
MLPLLSVFLVINVVVHTVTALPNGAPPSTCNTLLPIHGQGNLIAPLTSPSPFQISPQATAVAQGQILRIQIDATPPELTFGGFMLLARSTTPPYRVVGRFAPSADGSVKLMQCGGPDNAVTHTSTAPKRGFGFDWQAPSDFVGEVVFK